MVFLGRRSAIAVALLVALSLGVLAHLALNPARAGSTTVLVPIGAGYEEETLALFVRQAIAANDDTTVTLRVLPFTYATHPYTITAQEHDENLALAVTRAGQIQAVCAGLVVTPILCETTVVDIQVRADASDPARVAQLGPGVDGMYILGGDQVIAMMVVANTPAEAAMAARFAEGAVVSGNSAGAAVQSRYMIAGYIGDNYAWHGLNHGAIDLWYGATNEITRGLSFGQETAVIEQHALERGRLARLLQAAQRKPGPAVGVGTDWGTGAAIIGGQTLTETAGYYAAVVLDEETYGSAEAASYNGPSQTLSIRDVAFHVLPEGGYGYDLQTLRPIVDGATDSDAPDISARSLNFFRAPIRAGSLLLGGDLSAHLTGDVMQRFATLAQATGAPTVVVAAGYATDGAAESAAEQWATALGGLGVTEVQTATLSLTTNPTVLAAQLAAAGAIAVTGGEQQILAAQVPVLQQVGIVAALREGWHGGKHLLLDNAATAVAGDWVTAEAAPADYEVYASDSFIADYVTTAPGLGLIPGATFEPRVLYDYFYGRLVNHVYQHPQSVAFGIERGTALEITPYTTTVLGESALFVLDGRYARVREAGANDVIAATWLLIDTFAPGDTVVEQSWEQHFPLVASSE